MTAVPERERGFALITALWAAMILALVTGSILTMSHTAQRAAHTGATLAELGEAADGAIAMVQLQLLAPDAATRLKLDGTPFLVACAGRTVQVRLQDAAGLIDLNMAPDVVLRRLLQVDGGVDADTAQTLADRIMDWREPGAGKRLNGAKAADYFGAGYAYAPREAPFASVEELQLVMGMTPTLFARIAPALTVASQTPSVDPQVAPQAVLLALPGADRDGVAVLLEQRAMQQQQNAPANNLQSGSLIGHAVRITATAQGASRAVRTREIELRVTGMMRTPFWTYRATSGPL